MENSARKFLWKTVEVMIDRPMWSTHPKYEETMYPCNYGFIPGTKVPDGKEIDAYVLGISEPLQEFRGQCIAIIHRINDIEDKLIVVPEWISFTDEEIRTETYFQEQYFQSEIIRYKNI